MPNDITPGDVDNPAISEVSITLKDAGGDTRPLPIRLRQLLKLALRGFHLRCTAAVDTTGKAVTP